MANKLKNQRHSRRVVRFGLPTLVVCALTLVALWRIGAPGPAGPTSAVGTSGNTSSEDRSSDPLTAVAGLLARNAVGRQAALEDVEVRDLTSPRTFWIDVGHGMSAFAVL